MDNDQTSRLHFWIAAEESARKYFANKFSCQPDQIDVQRAAMFILSLGDSCELLDRGLSGVELIRLLRDVDFNAWNVFEDVWLESSVLPGNVRKRIDEETIKQNGEKWRIHRYDIDPFPDLPHAHNLSNGIKMDLRNGKLYQKRELVGTIGKKELIEFRGRVSRIELPPLDS